MGLFSGLEWGFGSTPGSAVGLSPVVQTGHGWCAGDRAPRGVGAPVPRVALWLAAWAGGHSCAQCRRLPIRALYQNHASVRAVTLACFCAAWSGVWWRMPWHRPSPRSRCRRQRRSWSRSRRSRPATGGAASLAGTLLSRCTYTHARTGSRPCLPTVIVTQCMAAAARMRIPPTHTHTHHTPPPARSPPCDHWMRLCHSAALPCPARSLCRCGPALLVPLLVPS